MGQSGVSDREALLFVLDTHHWTAFQAGAESALGFCMNDSSFISFHLQHHSLNTSWSAWKLKKFAGRTSRPNAWSGVERISPAINQHFVDLASFQNPYITVSLVVTPISQMALPIVGTRVSLHAVYHDSLAQARSKQISNGTS